MGSCERDNIGFWVLSSDNYKEFLLTKLVMARSRFLKKFSVNKFTTNEVLFCCCCCNGLLCNNVIFCTSSSTSSLVAWQFDSSSSCGSCKPRCPPDNDQFLSEPWNREWRRAWRVTDTDDVDGDVIACVILPPATSVVARHFQRKSPTLTTTNDSSDSCSATTSAWVTNTRVVFVVHVAKSPFSLWQSVKHRLSCHGLVQWQDSGKKHWMNP